MRKVLTLTIGGVILIEVALAAYHVPIADYKVILIGGVGVLFVGLIAWLALLSHNTQIEALRALDRQAARSQNDRAQERREFYEDRHRERIESANRAREIQQLAAEGFMLLYNRAGQPLIAQFDEGGQQLTRALPAKEFGVVDAEDMKYLPEA